MRFIASRKRARNVRFRLFQFPEKGGKKVSRRVLQLLYPAVIFAVYLHFCELYLYRDFWFDEALTVLNFALQENLIDIYWNYPIPNNQILFTFLVRLWLTFQPIGMESTLWLRLLPCLLGGATLAAIYCLFKSRVGGGKILLPVLAAAAAAPPFLIYATAVRGYMASALWITFALHFALRFARKREWRSWSKYAFFCLLTVGTIASNLAVLAGVVLYALPLFGERFWKNRSFWLLAAAPPAMFALFYLPILPQFLTVMRLGEGWQSGTDVLIAVLASLAYSFGFLLIPATGCLLAFKRPNYNFLWSARAAIWLLPIPMALLLKTAPFPRVFFPFWPLWILLIAGGIRDLTAWACRRKHRWNQAVWIGALTLVVIGWGVLSNREEPRLAFSRRTGGAEADDYFYGYYLRDTHRPRLTMRQLRERFPDVVPRIYLSFLADPWPLVLYGDLYGISVGDENYCLLQGPNGPATEIGRRSLVILRADESPAELEKKFHCKLRKLFENVNHGVYQVE